MLALNAIKTKAKSDDIDLNNDYNLLPQEDQNKIISSQNLNVILRIKPSN
jgi:hypothetical protein